MKEEVDEGMQNIRSPSSYGYNTSKFLAGRTVRMNVKDLSARVRLAPKVLNRSAQ